MKSRHHKYSAEMPEDVFDALLDATAPVVPSPERAKSMRDRVLEQVRSAKKAVVEDFITIPNDQGEWAQLTPLAEIKMLRSDVHSRSFLVRMQPGAELPAHEHPAEEECLMLEGEMWIGDIHLRAGDYHVAPKGRPHGNIRSDTGALLFVRGANPDDGSGAYR